jgi:hypothetical protein
VLVVLICSRRKASGLQCQRPSTTPHQRSQRLFIAHHASYCCAFRRNAWTYVFSLFLWNNCAKFKLIAKTFVSLL